MLLPSYNYEHNMILITPLQVLGFRFLQPNVYYALHLTLSPIARRLLPVIERSSRIDLGKVPVWGRCESVR